jgi:hypothetical protein
MNTFRGEFPVTISGKEEKCVLTLNAIRIFCTAENVNLEDFDKYLSKDPLTAIPTIAYYAYINNRLKETAKGKGYTKELFIMEVLDNDQLESVTKAVADAMAVESSKEGNVKGAMKS